MSTVLAEPRPRQPKRLRSRKRAATSLLAHGQPMIWLTGGALVLCLAMIVGLMALVLAQGLFTFWPEALVEVRTQAGKAFLGEVTRREHYRPEPDVAATLPPDALGGATRRLIRTGNYELTNEHFNWVSDFQVASESIPEWAVTVERLTWGRFYGVPQAFLIDGKPVAQTPAETWAKFQQLHQEIRDRFRLAKSMSNHDVGENSRLEEKARLRMRQAEIAHGPDSPPHRQAREEYDRVRADCAERYQQITGRIAQLNKENARYQLVMKTVDGREQTLEPASIVRAYPANQLSFGQKLGVYIDRWAEFLTDDPRESNSEGGVFPPIFGTVMMTMIMSLIVVPFGVMAALYLREYARAGPMVTTVRIAVNNLAGVPSIVFGVFGLGFFCYLMGGTIDQVFFQANLPSPTFGTGGILWASLTLALLTLPVVIVSTEEALSSVPNSMREGSYACGAGKWQTIRRIVLPRAMPGIMTGMILAMARGAGEVAPLMLVGAVKVAPELPFDLHAPFFHVERSFMHLGFHIYDLGFQSQNSEAAKPMVYTTTLLLILIIVALNLAAIWLRTRLRRKFIVSQF
jgi:phosphate transport system permease protein